MDLQINDKVFISFPLHSEAIFKVGAMKKYDHRVATVIDVESYGYRLNIDDGKYLWPGTILGRITRR